MKTVIKKYLLSFSILTSLVMGTLIAQPAISLIYPTSTDMNSDIAYSTHAAYMGRDINRYTQEATAIMIGKVRAVSQPYLREGRGITSQQNIQIDIEEVLKGDPNVSDMNILIEGGHTVVKSEENNIGFMPEEKENLFEPGEKILLFIGKTTEGDYVPFAGPYGKYLIDENENVTSIGDFRMSFKELKTQIQEALRLPVQEHKSIPVEKMY
jgi:hypothetical protein